MSDDFKDILAYIGKGIVFGFVTTAMLLLAVGLLGGCASECAYKSNGYCYHVD